MERQTIVRSLLGHGACLFPGHTMQSPKEPQTRTGSLSSLISDQTHSDLGKSLNFSLYKLCLSTSSFDFERTTTSLSHHPKNSKSV